MAPVQIVGIVGLVRRMQHYEARAPALEYQIMAARDDLARFMEFVAAMPDAGFDKALWTGLGKRTKHTRIRFGFQEIGEAERPQIVAEVSAKRGEGVVGIQHSQTVVQLVDERRRATAVEHAQRILRHEILFNGRGAGLFWGEGGQLSRGKQIALHDAESRDQLISCHPL